MEQNNNFTVLVNSSDNFEDCWMPFFSLFKLNGHTFKDIIILNTEFKEYRFDGLEIFSTKVHQDTADRKLTWSECLIKALDYVKTDIVFYLQEDYFIEKNIDFDFINNKAELMLKDSTIKRIGLTTNDYRGSLKETEYVDLWEATINTSYKISTQASLWRKDSLLNYLRSEESGWMFEIFGTWRTRKRSTDRFLTLNRNFYNNGNPIVSYLHTGIIKGKWHPGILKVFKEQRLNVDFSERGFYDIEKSKVKSKIEILRKLLSKPALFVKALANFI